MKEYLRQIYIPTYKKSSILLFAFVAFLALFVIDPVQRFTYLFEILVIVALLIAKVYFELKDSEFFGAFIQIFIFFIMAQSIMTSLQALSGYIFASSAILYFFEGLLSIMIAGAIGLGVTNCFYIKQKISKLAIYVLVAICLSLAVPLIFNVNAAQATMSYWQLAIYALQGVMLMLSYDHLRDAMSVKIHPLFYGLILGVITTTISIINNGAHIEAVQYLIYYLALGACIVIYHKFVRNGSVSKAA